MNKILVSLPLIIVFWSCSEYSSNGERMFMTGLNDQNRALVSVIDRTTLSDPSLILTCSACHGEDRKGKISGIPDFGPYRAPDITTGVLLLERPNRPAYNRATLAVAITQGKNPTGKGLHYPMPKWHLTDDELLDLLEYLLHQ